MEIKKMTDEYWWKVIDQINWTRHKKREILISRLTNVLNLREDRNSLKEFVKTKRLELVDIFQFHAYVNTGNKHGYFNVSDDGFWDLTAHIVGMGKDFYELCVKNPDIALNISVVENFQYIFNEDDIRKNYINVDTPIPVEETKS